MTNPFETPQAQGSGPVPPGGGPGTVDVATALNDGWAATQRNWLPWLLVLIASGVVGGFSVLLCLVPAILVLPLLSWGTTKFSLDAVDGEAEFGVLFSAFNDIGKYWLPMFLVMILLFLAQLPGQIISFVFQFTPALIEGDDPGVLTIVGSLLGSVIQIAWQLFVTARFLPATFLVVEREVGAVDAMTEAWNLTDSAWPTILLFQIVGMIVVVVGLLFCFVGAIPASMVVAGGTASIWRQLSNTRRA